MGRPGRARPRIEDLIVRSSVAIPADASAAYARHRMRQLGLEALPIVGGGRVLGLVDRVDLERAIRIAPEGDKCVVALLMPDAVVTAKLEDPLDAAVHLFEDTRVRAVIVLERDAPLQIAGVLTVHALLRVLLAELASGI